MLKWLAGKGESEVRQELFEPVTQEWVEQFEPLKQTLKKVWSKNTVEECQKTPPQG